MSWVYRQTSGTLAHDDGFPVATGYSGHGEGKNNPAKQDTHRVGPIPQGRWVIGAPHDDDKMGPYVLPLVPEFGTETFGRSEFYIHGDSLAHPGEASLGCVIFHRDVREQIWTSGDHHLVVTV